MNKFLQFLLGLTAFVWLVIGLALVAGAVLLIIWNPVARFQQATQGLPEQIRSILPFKLPFDDDGLQSMLRNISPQQISCAQKALGKERFQALTSGKAQPSGSDLTKATACLK